MAHCVNKTHPDFINLSQSLNISPETLDGLIQVWQDENDSDAFPDKDYILKKLKLTGESNTRYSSQQDYETAHNIWNKSFQTGLTTPNIETADRYYKDALNYFAKEDVGFIPRLDGTYEVKVLEPRKKIGMSIPENIFDIASDTDGLNEKETVELAASNETF